MTRAWLLGLGLGLAAPPLAAQETHLLVVSGLSGEPRFAENFSAWTSQLSAAARGWGAAAGDIVVLSEQGEGTARSTRENVLRAVAGLGSRAGAQAEVLIVLLGHGSESGGEARINLPGPDVTARELAAALDAVRAKRVVVVNTASASGAFVKPLARPGRIVITATKSGGQQNETLFPGYFVAALAGSAADTDKDERVSVLEAFEYARREVERAYGSTQRLQTEHALLDADGDGVGTERPVAASGDGAAAALAYFGSAAARVPAAAPAAAATPELRALLAEKTELEAALTALRGRRAELPDAEYQAELERLLLALSRNGQAIRRLEGGGR